MPGPPRAFVVRAMLMISSPRKPPNHAASPAENTEVALAISSIHFPHGDAADHFLAATAKTFDLTLVTADEQLINLPGIHVLPNR
jgi:PIN domain nuclease of toxin-antitoxin system